MSYNGISSILIEWNMFRFINVSLNNFSCDAFPCVLINTYIGTLLFLEYYCYYLMIRLFSIRYYFIEI